MSNYGPLETPEQNRLRRTAENIMDEAWSTRPLTEDEWRANYQARDAAKKAAAQAKADAERAKLQAIIDRDGGVEFMALFDGDQQLEAEIVQGGYGKPVWLMSLEEKAKYKRTFIPTGPHSRIQRELGLHEERILFPAKIETIIDGYFKIVKDKEKR